MARHALTVGKFHQADLALCRIPAVGVQDLPGHVAGILASQEQEARSDLVRLARPLHRSALPELGDLLRRLTA